MKKPFILFCAGEDSGDVLGEAFVRSAIAEGFDAKGAGGIRMQSAGLLPIVPFDDLPVNGFGDVFLHYFHLREHFHILASLLKDPSCKGFIAVDYPGFNLRLMKIAECNQVPVRYVAPPQIWAWKEKRGELFKGKEVYVLFDFEREVYEKFGASVKMLAHPFDSIRKSVNVPCRTKKIFLFPGSRMSQAFRNVELYRGIATVLKKEGFDPSFVASRELLLGSLKEKLSGEFPVLLSPSDSQKRYELFASASFAFAVPGSSIVEMHKAGVRSIAVSRIEPLTYLLGKLFLKTKFLTVPNIEAVRKGDVPPVPEYVFPSCQSVFSQIGRVLSAFHSIKL
ncbi:MAG: hypothetical protein M0P13_04365 [Fibrobacteraceae bacterium]|nr:hypothetical protein [Fibrobacteraceae bacterium]